MDNLSSLMNRLVTVVRDDLGGQEQLLELLEAQEASVLARDIVALEGITADMNAALRTGAERAARRQRVLDDFARVWDIPAAAITLGSVAERYGAGAEKLLELRAQLRDRTATVVRKGRRIAALVGLHRRVTHEVLDHLMRDESGNEVHDRGVLFDTEV